MPILIGGNSFPAWQWQGSANKSLVAPCHINCLYYELANDYDIYYHPVRREEGKKRKEKIILYHMFLSE